MRKIFLIMKCHLIRENVAEPKTIGVAELEAAGVEVLKMENADKFAFVRVCPCIFEGGYKNLRFMILRNWAGLGGIVRFRSFWLAWRGPSGRTMGEAFGEAPMSKGQSKMTNF
jgi:hypothetical protein